ncbi:hypothetical protein [Pedobacter hiemivivus]|uniref:DUF4919 domain-containing protein n=1 Tax=Pedobacter hiemivivus TaxID=2530454 RepID=A0A4R0NAG4_9SPHI|nr:hypothetical protein [Pedobacter hiemivivus]TCC97105.1 hypothetical protein EZ444_09625 [Pedobacter hiemivivus]
MKRLLLLAIATAFGTLCYAQKPYTNPNFKQLSSQHKLIAILPADVKITYKAQPRYFDYEANRDKENELAYKVQSALYTFLLEREMKSAIGFQDLEKTNLLLKRAGMIDSLKSFSKDEIAKALGVDAVVSENYELEHFNARPDRTNPGPTERPSALAAPANVTGSATLTVLLNDSTTGNLLWRFYTNDRDFDVFSTMDTIERVAKKPVKNFPYAK